MRLEPGTMVTPNVRLVALLGEGGMGSVWVAEHLTLETRVAVKFVSAEALAEGGAGIIARFKREAKAAAKIKSPHVVHTHDHGVLSDGTPYIIMELLEGESLAARLRRTGSLSLKEAALVVSQVGKALTEAHRLGIVHRDLKPDNLFLTSSAGELLVKVLDFGIAKHSTARKSGVLTASGAFIGTPEYMSPEQMLSSKHVDHRTDVWSLGAVAYEALTGELAFRESGGGLVLAICNARYAPPSTVLPGLPAELDGWFARALAPRLEDRFGSAREMAEAFEQIATMFSSASTLLQAHGHVHPTAQRPPPDARAWSPGRGVVVEQDGHLGAGTGEGTVCRDQADLVAGGQHHEVGVVRGDAVRERRVEHLGRARLSLATGEQALGATPGQVCGRRIEHTCAHRDGEHVEVLAAPQRRHQPVAITPPDARACSVRSPWIKR
jgi:serine/threonine-protein kinase